MRIRLGQWCASVAAAGEVAEACVLVVVDCGTDGGDDAERHPVRQVPGDAVPERLLELWLLEGPDVERGKDLFAQCIDVDAAFGQLSRPLRPDVARKPRRQAKQIELARADQVQGPSHQGGLVNEVGGQRMFELIPREGAKARPQPDVWRRRVLRLHPREPLDGAHRVEAGSLEQHLARECPAIQLPEGDGGELGQDQANLPHGYSAVSRTMTGILREVFSRYS